MVATKMALQDYFDIPNALFRTETPVVSEAECSFEIHWSGPVTSRGRVTGPSGSSGQLLMNQATMIWSASNQLGFKYRSDPSGTSSVFAQLGKVRNGVFAE
jgi:hypothetical protein